MRSHLFLALVTVVSVSGCEVVGQLREDHVTLLPGGEESLRVVVEMGAGELQVRSEDSKVLDAHFTWNVDSWEPRVGYQVRNRKGVLRIGHEQDDLWIPIGEARNRWELGLNRDLPMDLKVEVGIGAAKMNVEELNLSRLNIEVGAGELRLNLARIWEHNVKVHVDVGVGELRVEVPRSMGVRVHAERGLGEIHAPGFQHDGHHYTNSLFGQAEHTLDLHLEVGIGEIRIVEGEEIERDMSPVAF